MDIVASILRSAIFGGVAGTLVGLIPFYAGKNKNQLRLSEKAIVTCGISGVILGLILAIPVAVGYTLVIYGRYRDEIICPYCKEHINRGALICRYCEKEISEENKDV